MTTLPRQDILVLEQELHRLLQLGQAPPVEARLLASFLREVLEADPNLWTPCGFPVARMLARTVVRELFGGPDGGRQSLCFPGLSPRLLREIEAPLEACRRQPVPDWLDGAEDWPELREAALSLLQAERSRFESPSAGPERERAPDRGAAVWLPVVAAVRGAKETLGLYRGLGVVFLLRLRVKAGPLMRREPKPTVLMGGWVSEATRQSLDEALEVLSVVRVPWAPDPRSCWFRVDQSVPRGDLDGRSAGLALALGGLAALAALAPGRTQLEIAPGIAATGDLRGTEVVPVAVESLGAKVEAAFWGPATVLLVPGAQEAEAGSVLGRLMQEHRGGDLSIIGVRGLKELRSNPRIAGARGRGLGEILGVVLRRLATSRAFVIGLLIVGGLLAALVTREAWVSRKIPVALEESVDHLVITNPWGRICFTYSRGFCDEAGWDPHPGTGQRALLCDLDGRPPLELLTAVCGDGDHLTELHAVDARGKRIWIHDMRHPLSGLVLEDVHLGGFVPPAEPGHPLLLLSRSVQGPWTWVAALSPKSGRPRGLLRNRGHLENIERTDVDGDGVEDQVLLGQDNEAGAGLLVVVNVEDLEMPEDLVGPSSVTLMTDPTSLDRGARAVLRFPKDRFDAHERTVATMTCPGTEGSIIVSTEAQFGHAVLFHMDLRDLRSPSIRDVQITDGYRAILREKGIPAEEWSEEEARLKAGVTYLTGDGWRDVPAHMPTPGQR